MEKGDNGGMPGRLPESGLKVGEKPRNGPRACVPAAASTALSDDGSNKDGGFPDADTGTGAGDGRRRRMDSLVQSWVFSIIIRERKLEV